MDSQTVLTTREVAERLQLSERTVYRLIASRELPAVRFGGQYRIPVDALKRRLMVREGVAQATGTPSEEPAA